MARKTKELYELAPKKWPGHFDGKAPPLDASLGIHVGDFAIDLDAATGKNIWRCLESTTGSPIWSNEAVVTIEQMDRFESALSKGAFITCSTPSGRIKLGITPMPSGVLVKSVIARVTNPFNRDASLTVGVDSDHSKLATELAFDLMGEGVYETRPMEISESSSELAAWFNSNGSTTGRVEVSTHFEAMES